MKYIIDLNPDCVDGEFLRMPIRVAGEDQWIKTKASLTSYTEPDRKAIEDAQEEAWNLARKIMLCIADDGLTLYELRDCFGGDKYFTDVLRDYSYQETKAIYDAWKKENEIHVGDEVEYTTGGKATKFVVMDIGGKYAYGFKYPCMLDDVGDYCDLEYLRKTGRHFDEVEELLKKMKEES